MIIFRSANLCGTLAADQGAEFQIFLAAVLLVLEVHSENDVLTV